MQEFNSENALEFLNTKYKPGQLKRLGISQRNGNWAVDSLYLNECLKDKKLINKDSSVYLLKSAISNNSIEMVEYLLGKYKLKEEELFYCFEKSISYVSWNKNPKIPDLFYDILTDEQKLKVIDRNLSYSTMWINRKEEDIIFYFYEKGYVVFEGQEKNKRDLRNMISYWSLEMIKKIKFKIDKKFVKDFFKRKIGSKSFEYIVEYFFTLPEFKEMSEDEDIKYMKFSGSKLIDYYPKEERNKEIKRLLEQYKEDRKNGKQKTNEKALKESEKL